MFDCIFYHVRDLDRSVTFYTDAVGLQVESRDAVVRFRLDGVLIELVPVPESTAFDGTGNARLCLAVPDIQKAIAGLEARNVKVGEIHEVQNGMVGSFFDPDGNELALWQDGQTPRSPVSESCRIRANGEIDR